MQFRKVICMLLFCEMAMKFYYSEHKVLLGAILKLKLEHSECILFSSISSGGQFFIKRNSGCNDNKRQNTAKMAKKPINVRNDVPICRFSQMKVYEWLRNLIYGGLFVQVPFVSKSLTGNLRLVSLIQIAAREFIRAIITFDRAWSHRREASPK